MKRRGAIQYWALIPLLFLYPIFTLIGRLYGEEGPKLTLWLALAACLVATAASSGWVIILGGRNKRAGLGTQHHWRAILKAASQDR